jgi:hypothetical protein
MATIRFQQDFAVSYIHPALCWHSTRKPVDFTFAGSSDFELVFAPLSVTQPIAILELVFETVWPS